MQFTGYSNNSMVKLEMCQYYTDAPTQGPSSSGNKHFPKTEDEQKYRTYFWHLTSSDLDLGAIDLHKKSKHKECWWGLCLKFYRPLKLIGLYAGICPFRCTLQPLFSLFWLKRSFSVFSMVAAWVTLFTQSCWHILLEYSYLPTDSVLNMITSSKV